MVMTVPAEDRTLSPKGGEEILETALEAVAEQLRPWPNDRNARPFRRKEGDRSSIPPRGGRPRVQ